jgi:hypothetical protein
MLDTASHYLTHDCERLDHAVMVTCFADAVAERIRGCTNTRMDELEAKLSVPSRREVPDQSKLNPVAGRGLEEPIVVWSATCPVPNTEVSPLTVVM